MRVYPVPAFPDGRFVDLPGRGTTFIREAPGPSPEAPVVLLLHGWIAPGGLNWYTAIPGLTDRYHVITMDMRGHGRGIHTDQAFTFEDCADDAAALLQALGVDRAIVAGYSMGAQVAPLVAARHPERVAGVTLVSAVAVDHNGPLLGAALAATGSVMRHLPLAVRTGRWLPSWLGSNGITRPLDEVGHDDPVEVAQAGQMCAEVDTTAALRRIHVPSSVVISERDKTITLADQRNVAAQIPGTAIVSLQAGHTAPWIRPQRFSAAVRRGVDIAAGLG